MDVELQAHHVELTDMVRDYVDKKIGRLDRYLPVITSARVDLTKRITHSRGEVYSAQVTAWVSGTVLRSEEMHNDLYAAIDLAAEKIHRQIERYKGKRLDRWHGRSEPALGPELLEEAVASPAGSVTRRKRFPIYSMNEVEAVEQFDLLGHDFFLFRNADTGEFNVLYKRRDGELGLIEPELA
jgi:putative sigma-54 modulation protein